MYLVCNSRVWNLRASGYPMGWMMSPHYYRQPVRGELQMPWALDNGMYHAPDEPPKGMKMLPPFYNLLKTCPHRPLFAVVPDVPYDMDRSRVLSAKHLRTMRSIVDWPLAIAVQDGATPDDLDGYDAVFVGGSTDWKWQTCGMWCEEARARGMWSHIARVNTKRRIEQSQDAGADSVDGSGIFRGDRVQLRGVLDALVQPGLFAVVGGEKEIA
jgi:hypothetical protein